MHSPAVPHVYPAAGPKGAGARLREAGPGLACEALSGEEVNDRPDPGRTGLEGGWGQEGGGACMHAPAGESRVRRAAQL